MAFDPYVVVEAARVEFDGVEVGSGAGIGGWPPVASAVGDRPEFGGGLGVFEGIDNHDGRRAGPGRVLRLV